MNAKGNEIEDIINSLNNLNNKVENKNQKIEENKLTKKEITEETENNLKIKITKKNHHKLNKLMI